MRYFVTKLNGKSVNLHVIKVSKKTALITLLKAKNNS